MAALMLNDWGQKVKVCQQETEARQQRRWTDEPLWDEDDSLIPMGKKVHLIFLHFTLQFIAIPFSHLSSSFINSNNISLTGWVWQFIDHRVNHLWVYRLTGPWERGGSPCWALYVSVTADFPCALTDCVVLIRGTKRNQETNCIFFSSIGKCSVWETYLD